MQCIPKPMKFQQVLSLARTMTDDGMEVYIVKNTVYDLLQHKKTNNVQLAVSVGLRAVESFFKKQGYTVSKTTDDMLFGKVNGTNVQVMTLKYMTCDTFIEKVIPTDFTVNTLLMNTNEKIMDLHDAVSAMQNKQLIPVKGFDITKAQYNGGLYLDILEKIYRDHFSAKEDILQGIFEYLRGNAAKLNEVQKNRASSVFFTYCTDANCNKDFVIKFLNIKEFYTTVHFETLSEEGVNALVALPNNLFLIALAYLYKLSPGTNGMPDIGETPEYLAVKKYAGENLSIEPTYDKAFDEYGYNTLEAVVTIQRIIKTMNGEDYKVPRFHHKSVFTEMDERFEWRTYEGKVETPNALGFDTSFEQVSDLLNQAQMNTKQETPLFDAEETKSEIPNFANTTYGNDDFGQEKVDTESATLSDNVSTGTLAEEDSEPVRKASGPEDILSGSGNYSAPSWSRAAEFRPEPHVEQNNTSQDVYSFTRGHSKTDENSAVPVSQSSESEQQTDTKEKEFGGAAGSVTARFRKICLQERTDNGEGPQ